MKISNKALLASVLTFALVLASGSVLNVLGVDEVIDVVMLFMVLCCSLRFFGNRDKHWSSAVLFTLTVTMFIAAQCLAQGNPLLFLSRNNLKFVGTIVTVTLACGIYRHTGQFVNSLNNVLKLVLCHGLFSFVICAIVPPQTVLFQTFDGSAAYLSHFGVFLQRTHIDYFGGLAPNSVSVFGISFRRAHGLAWEPGNFAVFVNLLIFLNLFILRNRRWVILGVVGVLLSWSTVGLMTLVFQLMCALRQQWSAMLDRWFVLRIGGLIILTVALGYLVSTNYSDKIYGDNSGSGASRIINTVAAANTIMSHSLLGTGLHFQNYQESLDKSLGAAKTLSTPFVDTDKVNNVASTNSVLRVVVHLGIPAGFVLILGFFRQQLIREHKSILAVVLLLSLSSAPLFFYPFFLMFSVSGVMQIMRIDGRGV